MTRQFTPGRRSMTAGSQRFFVAMKQLTGMDTERMKRLIERNFMGKLPCVSTLDNLCRAYLGVKDRTENLPTIKQHSLKELRMDVFAGWFDDKEMLCEVAVIFEPWSEAFFVRVGKSFHAIEAIQSFVKSALKRFPLEYRERIKKITLYQHAGLTIDLSWFSETGSDRQTVLTDRKFFKSNYDPVYIEHFFLWDFPEPYHDRFRQILIRIVNDYNYYGVSGSVKEYDSAIDKLAISKDPNNLKRYLIKASKIINRGSRTVKPVITIYYTITYLCHRSKHRSLSELVRMLEIDFK